MSRWLLALVICCAPTPTVIAQVTPFPPDFHIQEIKTEAVTLHVRVGGHGPAVVLIHGFGDTGDMWAPLAADLARDHTVIVPDLRGMGLSSHPATGYDKRTEAADIRAVLEQLNIDHSVVIGHDIGTMVAYAYAARYPDKTDRLVVMDAPVPGIPPWDEIVRDPSSGTSRLVARMPNDWSPAGSASTSIASGMNLPAIRRKSTKRLASTTPSFMRFPTRCIRLSRSSFHSHRMSKTTRSQWRQN